MISKPVGISAVVISGLFGLGAAGLVATGALKLGGGTAPVPVGEQALQTPPTAQPERPVPATLPNAASSSPSLGSPSVATAEAAPLPEPVTAPLSQPAAMEQSSPTSGTSSSPPASAQRPDLNSADLKDLRKLPQITRTRARAIIKGRPYRSVSDLVDRKVISKKVFAAIKDLVEVR